MSKVNTAPTLNAAVIYDGYIERLKQHVNENDEGKKQKAIESLARHLNNQSASGIDVSQFVRPEDKAVIVELHQKAQLKGIPARYLEAALADSPPGANQERLNAGAQLAGAGVERKVKAAADKQENNSAAGKAAQDVTQATLETLAGGALGKFLEGLPRGVYGTKDLEKAREAAANVQMQAGMIDNPAVKDAIAILTDQPVSAKLQKTLALKAAKKGKPVDELRAELKEQMTKNLAQGREQVMDQAKDAFAKLDPRLRALEGTGKEVDEIFDRLKKGGSLAKADLAKLMAAADAAGPEELNLKVALENIENPQLRGMVEKFGRSRNEAQLYYKQNYDDLMAIINSPLPIEMVVMLVMAKLGERAERKLKQKMEQLALVEAIEQSGELKKEKFTLSDIGLSSSQAMMQQLQIEQTQWSNFMNALSGIMKSIEEMIATPVRNIGR